MSYFFDTSALVKIYHKEEGSEQFLNIYKKKGEIAISELAKVEFYSTIYRKYRESEINLETLNLLIKKFNFDTEYRYEVLPFSSGVTEQALDFLSRYGESKSIKALDSLQLAFFDFYCEKEDIFVSTDTKLINVVNEEKINTLTGLK